MSNDVSHLHPAISDTIPAVLSIDALIPKFVLFETSLASMMSLKALESAGVPGLARRGTTNTGLPNPKGLFTIFL